MCLLRVVVALLDALYWCYINTVTALMALINNDC